MFYNMIWVLLFLLFRCTGKIRIKGQENIPAEGPAVLIANHISNFDPVILFLVTRRNVHFMAKDELFHIPIFRTLARWMCAFPVNREQLDRTAVRNALKVLRDGGLLGIFPEGTRGDGKNLLPFKSGVAYIASQYEAPVVPIAITGSRNFLNPFQRPAHIVIGKPVYQEHRPGETKRQALDSFLKRQEEAVQVLLKNNVE